MANAGDVKLDNGPHLSCTISHPVLQPLQHTFWHHTSSIFIQNFKHKRNKPSFFTGLKRRKFKGASQTKTPVSLSSFSLPQKRDVFCLLYTFLPNENSCARFYLRALN
ncbi:hypothetical protein Droror1_Dr00019843 [Drosera rotundifolia]